MEETRVSHCLKEVTNKEGGREGYNEPCGTGLDSETSVCTYI